MPKWGLGQLAWSLGVSRTPDCTISPLGHLASLDAAITRYRRPLPQRNLWQEMGKVDRFIDKHFISIGGEGFFCVLRDKVDGQTKVQAVSRPPEWRAG